MSLRDDILALGADDVLAEGDPPSREYQRGFVAALKEAAALVPEWQTIETAPKVGVFLVWLTEPLCGSNVHAVNWRTNVKTVGTLFHFDAPKPIYWMPLPDPPKEER